jgi:hypothetical protein
MVIDWAVQQRAGTLAVGDPRGVLALAAGRGTTGGSATGASAT